MHTLITSLAVLQQGGQQASNQPSSFSLKMVLANLPHDPASVIVLALSAAAVAWVIWAGHRKPKDPSPEE